MNSDFLAPITEEEVKAAAVQLGAWKAPGPDGYQIYLYQKYWNIMSNIVSSTAIDFHNGLCSLEEINKTFIALIPKVQPLENTAIAIVIPAYPMPCFKFPVLVCSDINGDLVRFWWKNGEKGSKIHWKAWESL
ncbi:unnamed protein product [Prunus brigantina]